MKATMKLVADLATQDILLWVHDGQLHFSAAATALAEPVRQQLRQHRAELITLLSPQQGQSVPALRALPAQPTYKPSFAQERLWAIDQLEGPSSRYNEGKILAISGALQAVLLPDALSQVMMRQSVLRSRYIDHDGQAQMVIEPNTKPETLFTDARSWTSQQQQAEISRTMDRPFVLASGPLVRMTVLQTADTQFVIAFAMHHIISDGLSLEILIRELISAYLQLQHGQTVVMEPLSVQYQDFAAWQRELVQGTVGQQQVRYWNQQLSGAPDCINLKSDLQRPEKSDIYGGVHRFNLVADSYSGLVQSANALGTTPFNYALTAYNLMLAYFSASSDILVGTPVNQRNKPELESLIGLFVNTIVLRNDVSLKKSLAQLLTSGQQVVSAAMQHADVPFEMVLEALQIKRSPAYSPLYQARFVFLDVATRLEEIEQLQVKQLEQDRSLAKFELMLTLERVGNSYQAEFSFNRSLYLAATVERFACAYQHLLATMPRAHESTVAEMFAGLDCRLHEYDQALAASNKQSRLSGLEKLKKAQLEDRNAVV
ncbi:hypothetical protein A5320_02675 [Rheinheimera sp. SA_1]|uniref:condensation domain-containing protein n=1 Tax=Rheinheimera sp. SA_1 TaxID=1827365 RepID=UPI0007FFF9A5|nr:condensation domain-containing protein [Rheinheimera sp. SA_1]OBP16332.1 hypothetical protein A5320_02675 [Rheinheimera sp. SA_1]